MNKELYIKREGLQKKERELYYLISNLQLFLKENEKKFTKEESIKSLIKIKDYLELKKQEHECCEDKEKELYKELHTTCRHEIAIKYSNRPAYECLICNCCIDKDRNIIEKIADICIDTTNDYQVAYLIEDLFKEIVYSDKDLNETIIPFLENLQYERNIKVKRRII